jgi:hypothetical protein
LLSLLLYPENGSNIFLRNACWFSTHQTRYIVEEAIHHDHRRESLISNRFQNTSLLSFPPTIWPSRAIEQRRVKYFP